MKNKTNEDPRVIQEAKTFIVDLENLREKLGDMTLKNQGQLEDHERRLRSIEVEKQRHLKVV